MADVLNSGKQMDEFQTLLFNAIGLNVYLIKQTFKEWSIFHEKKYKDDIQHSYLKASCIKLLKHKPPSISYIPNFNLYFHFLIQRKFRNLNKEHRVDIFSSANVNEDWMFSPSFMQQKNKQEISQNITKIPYWRRRKIQLQLYMFLQSRLFTRV